DKYEAALAHHNLGDLYMFWSRCAESIAEEEKALAIYEKAVGPKHPDLSYPLENLGACWTELGQPARAIPILERALAIREAADTGDAAGLAQPLMALAVALWKGHGARARARALATRARQAFDKAGDIGPQEIPAVDK